MIKFPDINDSQTAEEKFKVLVEYLWQFHKDIEYQFENLSPENFNDKTIKELAKAIKEESADDTAQA